MPQVPNTEEPPGQVNQRLQEVMALLESEADVEIRAVLSERYGIHVDNAFGIPMRRLKAIAKDVGTDHDLALGLWSTGNYEAQTMAVFVDDPALVTEAQMQQWCGDFDNWAIVDNTCFNLFDRSPHAWSMVKPWANADELFVKRAGLALLWALALHDKGAPDQRFRESLPLIERQAGDPRHLVTKAATMAMRAIGQKRPGVMPDVVELAQRLTGSGDLIARRTARPILKAFAG